MEELPKKVLEEIGKKREVEISVFDCLVGSFLLTFSLEVQGDGFSQK